MNSIKHAMTVDVEDYFQVSAFESIIPRNKWSTYPFRVQANTEKILRIFEEHDVKATFFILGWVAKRCPRLIQEIHSLGHEIACHSYEHQRVDTMTQESFRQDSLRSKNYLRILLHIKFLDIVLQRTRLILEHLGHILFLKS